MFTSPGVLPARGTPLSLSGAVFLATEGKSTRRSDGFSYSAPGDKTVGRTAKRPAHSCVAPPAQENERSFYRIKRLIREAFRLDQHDLPAGYDVVCVAKRTKDPTLEEFRNSLGKLMAAAIRRWQTRLADQDK